MKLFSKIMSTVFGLGYFPLAPGTLTSLVVVIIYKYYLHKLNWPFYLALLVVVFIAGSLTSAVQENEQKSKDPRCIVIDEAIGQLIALFLMRPEWYLLGAGFILFRLLDILKPFIIRKAEAIHGGWGIMMDDVVAGLITSIVLNLYLILK